MSDFAGSLFIVGAQKAGTTSLHSYLKGHPQLACGDQKELHFFDRERVYSRGLGYYRASFPISAEGRLCFEATPKYLYGVRCAERIHAYSPEARIVIILREPVSRAFSAYNMYRQIITPRWFNSRKRNANQDMIDFLGPFVEAGKVPGIEHFLNREMEIINMHQAVEEPSIIRRGVYASQIERYVRLFGRDRVLILFSDELRRDPAGTLGKVFNFAGLTPMPARGYPLVNVRNYTANSAAREMILHHGRELFEKDRFDLGKAFGLEVPW